MKNLNPSDKFDFKMQFQTLYLLVSDWYQIGIRLVLDQYQIGIGQYEKNLIGNLPDRPILKMGFIGVYRNRLI